MYFLQGIATLTVVAFQFIIIFLGICKMENIIRSLVKEEISNALKSQTSEAPKRCATTNTDTEVGAGSSKQKRHGSVSSRLNGLLSKISKKGESASASTQKTHKKVKIQVRWIRICDEGKKVVVRQAEGGGNRFVSFPSGENPTFYDLLEKAIVLYFSNNGLNNYGELSCEVFSTLLDSSETELDLTDSVTEFLQNKGLFPSKTWFYLKTSPKTDDSMETVCDENILNAHKDENIFNTPAFTKRKICTVCCKTYCGDTCLACEQDQAYEQSLKLDQLQYQEKIDPVKKPDDEVNELHPDVDTVRSIRLSVFSKKQEIKTKSFDEQLTDLSQNFLQQSESLEDVVTFSVRRRNILNDVMKKMNVIFGERQLCKVNVQFTSFGNTEAGIDTGGPGREMVSAVYKQAPGPLLQGHDGRHVFVHDLAKIDSKQFHLYGKFVALALLHNYNPPHQFCIGLSNYIVGKFPCLGFF